SRRPWSSSGLSRSGNRPRPGSTTITLATTSKCSPHRKKRNKVLAGANRELLVRRPSTPRHHPLDLAVEIHQSCLLTLGADHFPPSCPSPFLSWFPHQPRPWKNGRMAD